jgi:hypothetical protein
VVDLGVGVSSVGFQAEHMRFVLFVIDDATNSGNPDEMAAIDAFNDSLRANGQWVFACGIGAPNTATLVDGRGGRTESASGSLISDDTFYTGFWVIDVDDRTEAERLAIAGSRACNRRVELRPLL